MPFQGKCGITAVKKKGEFMMGYVVRQTPCGSVRGMDMGEGYALFRNIPYATANRWERPVEVTDWEGEWDASTPTPWCPQAGTYATERDRYAAFYGYENTAKQAVFYSEDCQRLNIWMPDGAQKAPVLVYIHGGSYCNGGSSNPAYNSAGYAKKGLVAVTINYRLNAFGSAVGGGHTGNYGLWDQITALTWIQHNIAAFGGDPDRVTIIGESAGAMSVQDLVWSPLAAGLFHGAIMMSGGGILPLYFARRRPQEAERVWEIIRKTLGAEDWEQMRSVPAETLYRTWLRVTTAEKYLTPATPVIDGITIPDEPLALAKSGRINNVPMIIGLLSEDMWPNTLYEAALEWGLLMEEAGCGPVYGYYFDRQLPGSDHGAFHGADIRYAFGTFDTSWRPFEAVDYRISENIMDYFTAFATTGVPGVQDLAKWEPLGKDQTKFLNFGDAPCAMIRVPADRLIATQAKDQPFPKL